MSSNACVASQLSDGSRHSASVSALFLRLRMVDGTYVVAAQERLPEKGEMPELTQPGERVQVVEAGAKGVAATDGAAAVVPRALTLLYTHTRHGAMSHGARAEWQNAC